MSSGATTIQALVGGSVQAALGASNAVVAATLKGAPIIAVGGNSSRPGMQLWVQPEIQRAEQLAAELAHLRACEFFNVCALDRCNVYFRHS